MTRPKNGNAVRERMRRNCAHYVRMCDAQGFYYAWASYAQIVSLLGEPYVPRYGRLLMEFFVTAWGEPVRYRADLTLHGVRLRKVRLFPVPCSLDIAGY